MNQLSLQSLPNRLMRPSEVGRLLGISRNHLYRKIRQGTFPPPIRIGHNSLAWPEEEVVAWLNSQRVKTNG